MIPRLAVLLLAALSLSQGPPLPPDYQPSPNPQRAPEQYPGQHDHAKPPDGWMCAPPNPRLDGPQPEHPCSCKRMTQRYSDGTCVLNEDGSEHVQEDPVCSVYCHMASCTCAVHKCDT